MICYSWALGLLLESLNKQLQNDAPFEFFGFCLLSVPPPGLIGLPLRLLGLQRGAEIPNVRSNLYGLEGHRLLSTDIKGYPLFNICLFLLKGGCPTAGFCVQLPKAVVTIPLGTGYKFQSASNPSTTHVAASSSPKFQ